MHAKSLQLCLTLCNPMDCSPPGSSVLGILQTRILEWVAMPSSRGSSQPRDLTCVSYVSCISRRVLYHQHHLGSPIFKYSLKVLAQFVIKQVDTCRKYTELFSFTNHSSFPSLSPQMFILFLCLALHLQILQELHSSLGIVCKYLECCETFKVKGQRYISREKLHNTRCIVKNLRWWHSVCST